MSFRVKFFITIIGLVIIVVTGILFLSEDKQYVTISEFVHNDNKKDGEVFIVPGIVTYALNNKLYVDDAKQYAVFNLVEPGANSSNLLNSVKIAYDAKLNSNVEFSEGDHVIITGEYKKENYEFPIAVEQSQILSNILVSKKLQTKCDSKYEYKSTE